MNFDLINVGIAGTGIYIPKTRMTAAQISEATRGVWSAQAVEEKLGIRQKAIPGPGDGTQEMGVRAAMDVLKNTGIKAEELPSPPRVFISRKKLEQVMHGL